MTGRGRIAAAVILAATPALAAGAEIQTTRQVVDDEVAITSCTMTGSVQSCSTYEIAAWAERGDVGRISRKRTKYFRRHYKALREYDEAELAACISQLWGAKIFFDKQGRQAAPIQIERCIQAKRAPEVLAELRAQVAASGVDGELMAANCAASRAEAACLASGVR